MKKEIAKIAESCRATADMLDSCENHSLWFPGWEYDGGSPGDWPIGDGICDEMEHLKDRERNAAIRRAAKGIARTSGATVRMRDVASLIRYVADLLETPP